MSDALPLPHWDTERVERQWHEFQRSQEDLRLLHDHPELVRARSTREHRSTLLHYVSANGVEDFRQKTPKNILDITKLLLTAGADVNAESGASMS